MIRARILIVDDDELFRDTLTRGLGDWFSHVAFHAFPSTCEAAILGGQYDVVLMDERLGGGRTGGEIIASVLTKRPSQKFIRITGYRTTMVQISNVPVMEKPITLAGLKQAIIGQLGDYEGPKRFGEVLAGIAMAIVRIGFSIRA